MCGFLGEFMYQENTLIAKEDFHALLRRSSQRGPDATGTFSGSNYQLGFNRLAIIDLSAQGNQPMKSPTQRYHLVFNGEIYNFQELREHYELKNLISSSDTEVIVHLLDLLGVEKTFHCLNGMFAIAVVDTKEDTLYMTRDFAGIKPLFFGYCKQGIVFASQFNQLIKHPYFYPDLQMRPEIIKEYFGLGYMQAPNTIYKNIYQVNPGELIKISKEGNIQKRTICAFAKDLVPTEGDTENQVLEFDKLFTKVINRQLKSDVSLAAFLSGGIDSPLVCAQAIKQQPSIETFTVGLNHKKYDESLKAAEYARQIGAKHHIERIDSSQLIEHVDRHFRYMTEPFGDYSSIPTYVITRMAKKRHTVMLAGDGGDELFFGYPRMLDILKNRHWFKISHSIRKPLVRIAIKLKLFNSWAPYSYKKLEDWVLGKHLHVSLKNLNRLVPKTPFSKEISTLYKIPKKHNKKTLLHWLRYNEFYAHLQRVLVKVDRMSMANSLEVRVPFLDKKSIDFAWQYQADFKRGKSELKELLKRNMERYYPKELIEHEKKGFAVPVEDWLHNQLKHNLKKVIFERSIHGSEWIDTSAIKQYVSDYYDGKHQEAWGIWHIYAWQKWAEAEELI